MRRLTWVILIVLAAAAQSADAQDVDYGKSEITFVGKQMNVPAEGRFRKFTAQIAFDPKQPDATRAEVEVDLGSIDTGGAESDSEVKKRAWLNVLAFPTAKFVSSTVKQIGPDRYEAAGKLTIKGISQDIRAPLTIKTTAGATTFEGVFTLLRLQFKVGEGVWSDTDTVANEVQVRFRLVTTGKK